MDLAEPPGGGGASGGLSATEYAATELRAEMARQQITGNQLPNLVGNSQSYWWRRLSGRTPLDVIDLATLGELLGVPAYNFLPPEIRPTHLAKTVAAEAQPPDRSIETTRVVAPKVPEYDLADRMRKSLRSASLSVQEIADYFEVSRNTVSSWINGHVKPSAQTQRLWAIRTGVPYDWLRYGTVDGDDPEIGLH